MGVNSGGSTTNNIYCQQVNVEKNTNYSLSAWASFIGIPAAALDFSINGQNIGSSLVLTNTDTCAWSQFSNQWGSGTNTTANICIKNRNTGVSGNDFSLDDIVFRKIDPATSSAQVGGCCPADSQWSSVQNKCVDLIVDKCSEGEYYCHAEFKCKPAGQTCGTITCNNNSICDINESCDCADCNEKADHCGIN